MVPEVLITEAVIDAFNNNKDVTNMHNVSERGQRLRRGQSDIVSQSYVVRVHRAVGSERELSVTFPHPTRADTPEEGKLAKVMAGLLVDILSCYRMKR
jgi:hypothetical protein